MEEIEDMNEQEFQWLIDNPQQLASFMEVERNRVILTPEQLTTAIGKLRN